MKGVPKLVQPLLRTNDNIQELAGYGIEERVSSTSKDNDPKEITTDSIQNSFEMITETVDKTVTNYSNFNQYKVHELQIISIRGNIYYL